MSCSHIPLVLLVWSGNNSTSIDDETAAVLLCSIGRAAVFIEGSGIILIDWRLIAFFGNLRCCLALNVIMAEPGFLKCSCQKCGGNIEFPATGTGATINCPHCGTQTTLSSGLPRSEVPPGTKKPKPTLLLVSGALLLVVILGTVIGVLHWPKKQKETVIPPSNPPVQTENSKESSPPPSDGTNDFIVSKISLQKTEGSGLVYAVGTVKNVLNRQRFGVRIELNLLDEQDENIGVASDYVSVIEPHKEWQFKALLTQPKTVKVTVADIKEQQ
jgi:hypothetical protein